MVSLSDVNDSPGVLPWHVLLEYRLLLSAVPSVFRGCTSNLWKVDGKKNQILAPSYVVVVAGSILECMVTAYSAPRTSRLSTTSDWISASFP